MVHFVNVRLLAFFNLTKHHSALESQRLSPQDYFEAACDSLRLDDNILRENLKKVPPPAQYSNVFIPPEALAPQKNPNPNPSDQKPSKKKRGSGSGGPPQLPVVKPAGGSPGAALAIDKQLCLNRFAHLIGVGTDCDKKPGQKGYPCKRLHVTAPLGGAKWPTSTLDDAVDACNRINNPILSGKVMSAIALLR